MSPAINVGVGICLQSSEACSYDPAFPRFAPSRGGTCPSRHATDPQIRWPLLCTRVGTETWVKHENHSPVGAFKVRGGLVYMDSLRRCEPKVTGVIAATRGNHGQSVAFAASRLGLRSVIVVPYGNSREKNAAMRALGVSAAWARTLGSRPRRRARCASRRKYSRSRSGLS